MALKLIESDVWRLWSDPEVGVQWMAAEVHREGAWHAVVPDCRAADGSGAGQSAKAPLAAANFHMLPYSNRIKDGKFDFQGQSITLENGENHAIHGPLRKLPWRVTRHDNDALTCEFHSTDHPGINWPWAISARLEQKIAGNLLSSHITLTNESDTDMPAGFGWHPYFVQVVNGSEPTLTLPVDGVFPDAAGDCLPDGEAVPLPESLDFRQPRKLDADQRIDCCLSGLHGTCEIDWQDGGIKLLMQSSDLCRYLVLFNPDMPHFAVEPVTNANDAFNLSTRGIESGTQVLKPGESLHASMNLVAQVS